MRRDGAIRAVWIAGALAALFAIVRAQRLRAVARRVPDPVALDLHRRAGLSVVPMGHLAARRRDFLALFADQSRVRVWLFRWLVFRLMFFSGVVKLLSGDPTWRDLTAMRFHYETQPLPTPLAWYMHQLPLARAEGLDRRSPSRRVAGAGAVLRAAAGAADRRRGSRSRCKFLILATGNYTFFNWLTIVLCMWLFIEPEPHRMQPVGQRRGLADIHRDDQRAAVSGAFGIPMPPGGSAMLHASSPLRIVNSYGLFAVMTTRAPGDHRRGLERRRRRGPRTSSGTSRATCIARRRSSPRTSRDSIGRCGSPRSATTSRIAGS